MKLTDLDDQALRELAGEASFKRGLAYHRERRVEISFADERGLKAVAHGQTRYVLSLGLVDSTWRWHCSCPAADDGSFCKHLVAAALTANDGEIAPFDAGDTIHSPRRASLAAFLHAQPATLLAEWLLRLADEDPELRDRLEVLQAGVDPGQLKTTLTRILAVRGFMDFHRTRDFARKLDPLVESLGTLCKTQPDAAIGLCELALRRLFRIYENCDDSSGLLGEQAAVIAELHAAACCAAPPGQTLAKPLHALKLLDDWQMLPLSAYWEALGREGQSAYARLVLKSFEALPAPRGDAERFGPAFGVTQRTAELARVSGDLALLLRVLRRDSHEAYGCLRIIQALQEFDRHAEALAEAERAVKRWPKDSRLRDALATCLQQAGLDDESLSQRWELFLRHPSPATWDDLRACAKASWPAYRERALAELAAQRDSTSLRIQLLMHDQDLAAASALAQDSPVLAHVLNALADRLRSVQPTLAGAFYLRLLDTDLQRLQANSYKSLVVRLRHIRECLPGAASTEAIARVRREHARKPKLMAMMDKAGL